MAFKVVNKKFLEQLETTPDDQKVLIVTVKRATNLPKRIKLVDPFCRLNLVQPVHGFDQLQRTSRACEYASLCLHQ